MGENGRRSFCIDQQNIPSGMKTILISYFSAARSLGREDLGHLHPGAQAKVALWDVKHPLELVYWMGEAYTPAVLSI